MTISRDTFGALFEGFQYEAFRLATLADYGTSDAHQAFLAGEPKPTTHNTAWRAKVQRHTAAGHRIYRVHILARPLTPYLHFELSWGYRTNTTAGEEFFILDITEKPNPLEGVPDFWLFDESTAVSLAYGTTGSFLRAEQQPEPHTWIHHRDTALHHAEPFTDWQQRHRIRF
ncbi:DUF6879 family protein [Streptomyces sp. 1331.2]|uniref:DUF6879 family protein n=1 Tax=Streptomyces sp. 1331.2 TaxID=1938835 RepID=UPI000BC90332|nr:DUF6879 family protein [Streptomyces sp. 1331.2]SOB82166.1 hypothetical protein SAMN06272789_2323 [Streptomyces sp. 1331.2]